jgi:hypothetical protein
LTSVIKRHEGKKKRKKFKSTVKEKIKIKKRERS